MPMRGWMLWSAMLVAGCGEPVDDDRPLDGGQPLGEPLGPERMKEVADQPCARVERGRRHYSVGHCEAMTPARAISGVWVTAFEERSFFPGATAVPDANDPRRFGSDIEIDERDAIRLSGHSPADPRGEAYLLTFEGRRTRDPWFDCHGVPSFSFVVDRLKSARHLGPMGEIDRDGMLPRYEAYAKRLSGRFGKAQAEAVERCRRVPADRIEEAAGGD